HRLPDEPAGAGSPDAGAGAGAAGAAEGAAHPRDRLGQGQGLSETTVITRRLSLAPDVDLGDLLGRNDDHLRTLESEFDVKIVARGHDVMLKGDERQVRRAERALTQLAELLRSGAPLRGGEVRAAVKMVAEDDEADLKAVFSDAIAVPSRKKWIT